jgi:hypothetical protein
MLKDKIRGKKHIFKNKNKKTKGKKNLIAMNSIL